MIISFPCPYGIDHLRTMNEVLGVSFQSFVPSVLYARWKASRQIRTNMLAELSHTLNNDSSINGVFFSNLLADASPNFKSVFPKVKLFGFVHGSNISFRDNPLASKTKIVREKKIYQMTDAVFVGSNYIRDLLQAAFPFLEGKIFVVGFPFKEEVVTEPGSRKPVILYNHRFDGNKQPFQFRVLKEMLPNFSFIATSPNFNAFVVGALKKSNIRVHICPNEDLYRDLLRSAMFQVSFAKFETFGVATQIAVLSGAFALAPKRASYPEFLPEEMLYDDLSDLRDKVCYYTKHPKERMQIIRNTQQTFKRRFSERVWRNKVLNKIRLVTR